MNKFLVTLFIVFAPLFSFTQTTLFIKNVNIVDVKGNKIIKSQSVVIKGNRIVAITTTPTPPQGAAIIDGRGKYLMPGLWDMHAHTLTDKRYVYCFPLLLANGITGVRDMADNLSPEEVNQIRKDVESGKIIGPRFGAVTYRLMDGAGTQFSNVAVVVNIPEEGRELVRRYKQQGADFIKPYNLLSRETYLAIADEAKKQKIPLEGHVPFAITPAEASNLGQKTIEHNFGVLLSCSDNSTELEKQTRAQPNLWARFEAQAAATYNKRKADSLYKLFVRNGTWSCPTIITYRPLRLSSDTSLLMDSALSYIPKQMLQSWHETFMQRLSNVPDVALRKMRDSMRMVIVGDMYRAGVRLLAGTDMPVPYIVPGFSLHDELELLVQSGLSNIDALRTATINPARFLNREKDLGSVEKGKLADLILLNDNPLKDVSNTRKIDAVIVNGKLLYRKALDEMLHQLIEIAVK